jgi:DNA-binding transcriptional regulator PaaX
MNKNKKTISQTIEDFRNSDSIPATATKFILGALLAGPLIFAGAALPGLLSASKSYSSKKYSKTQLRNSLKNLKYRKYIEVIKEKDGKIKVQLTNKGQKRIKEFSLETLAIKKPMRWDKKWRILIFDIPTKPKIYNQAREALRAKIKDLGFHQIQKSVWVYPYECEDELLLVAEIYHVQKYIEIITADKLLHEGIVKRKFNL